MVNRSLPIAGLALALAMAVFLAARPGFAAPKAQEAVVVELFTSQGCSSCPPADAMLGDLRDLDGIVALSLHVDYWDYIGWEDPYALGRHTERQREYTRILPNRFMYTPQMVIDGRYDAVGSRRGEVMNAIAQARNRYKVPITLSDDKVVVGPGESPDGEPAAVWLVLYDESHQTPVQRGENAGRDLRNFHVVREWRRLGTWDGGTFEAALDMAAAMEAGRDGCAVILQKEPLGEIIGAAQLDF